MFNEYVNHSNQCASYYNVVRKEEIKLQQSETSRFKQSMKDSPTHLYSNVHVGSTATAGAVPPNANGNYMNGMSKPAQSPINYYSAQHQQSQNYYDANGANVGYSSHVQTQKSQYYDNFIPNKLNDPNLNQQRSITPNQTAASNNPTNHNNNNNANQQQLYQSTQSQYNLLNNNYENSTKYHQQQQQQQQTKAPNPQLAQTHYQHHQYQFNTNNTAPPPPSNQYQTTPSASNNQEFTFDLTKSQTNSPISQNNSFNLNPASNMPKSNSTTFNKKPSSSSLPQQPPKSNQSQISDYTPTPTPPPPQQQQLSNTVQSNNSNSNLPKSASKSSDMNNFNCTSPMKLNESPKSWNTPAQTPLNISPPRLTHSLSTSSLNSSLNAAVPTPGSLMDINQDQLMPPASIDNRFGFSSKLSSSDLSLEYNSGGATTSSKSILSEINIDELIMHYPSVFEEIFYSNHPYKLNSIEQIENDLRSYCEQYFKLNNVGSGSVNVNSVSVHHGSCGNSSQQFSIRT